MRRISERDEKILDAVLDAVLDATDAAVSDGDWGGAAFCQILAVAAGDKADTGSWTASEEHVDLALRDLGLSSAE